MNEPVNKTDHYLCRRPGAFRRDTYFPKAIVAEFLSARKHNLKKKVEKDGISVIKTIFSSYVLSIRQFLNIFKCFKLLDP